MLQENHLRDFRSSGITDETIEAYKPLSITNDEANKRLGFNVLSGGWSLDDPDGRAWIFKPDKLFGDNKYLTPKNEPPDLFMSRRALNAHNDIAVPYFVVEGAKKALAIEQVGLASFSTSGVWNWRSSGRTCERLAQINLTGRIVYIIFDSDKYTNEHVMRAEKRLAQTLVSFGATVRIVNLDPAFGKGADDQLLRLGEDGFQYYVDNAVDYIKDMKDEVLEIPPIPLSEFVKKDIPPVKYYVDSILQLEGKTMVSAPANIGKSIFLMNLALAIASGETQFIGRFNINHDN